jgi:hypothetical protein
MTARGQRESTIFMINPKTGVEMLVKNEGALDSGKIQFEVDPGLLKLSFESLGKMVFEVRSRDPLPQLPNDIILEIMKKRIDDTHTGLAQVSGVSKSMTAALKSDSLRYSSSGNIDQFVDVYGRAFTINNLYVLPMTRAHVFFLNQLQALAHGLITEAVWKFDKKYAYDRTSRTGPPALSGSPQSGRLKWENLWVYAKLLSYIGSRGIYLQHEIQMYDSVPGRGKTSGELVDVLNNVDFTTNFYEIKEKLRLISFESKRLFPIWKTYPVMSVYDNDYLREGVGYGEIFINRMRYSRPIEGWIE